MELRPHHLLCLQKFTGHGYDERFTESVSGAVSRLKGKPSTQVTVVKGCDALCGACPNNVGNVCLSYEKADALDRAVLDACGLSYGQSASWAQLAALSKQRILKADGFAAVCGDCEWFGLCANTEV